MNRGPRVFVKRDEESSVGRGAILYGAHWRPEIAAIVWAACVASKDVSPGIKEVILTEGYRDIRDTRDLHEELRALDITFRLDHQLRPTLGEYARLRDRMKELLGPDYDVLAHGEDTQLHIHSEYD